MASIEPSERIGGSSRVADRLAKGLGFKVFALRVNPADYTAQGLVLTPALKKQMGMNSVQGIVGLSWTTSPTGTPPTATVKPILMTWDVLNQSIRAFSGGTELTGAGIAANDLVRFIVIGG